MTNRDHVWHILDDVLLLLAEQYYPTPERTYKLDGGWSLALADLKRCFADLRAQLAAAEAERDAARSASQKDREWLGRALEKQAEYLGQSQMLVAERDAARVEVERLRGDK